MSDYQALTRAGWNPLAAAQIVKDAKAGDPAARAEIAKARSK